jgi:lipopolysaccharide export LptBFGC system permease protein LptF
MTDRTITSRMNLSWSTVAKNAQEAVRVLGVMMAWTVAGVAVYVAGNFFGQSGFAGRWVAIWLALGWVLALTLFRNRVRRLERSLAEIRRN